MEQFAVMAPVSLIRALCAWYGPAQEAPLFGGPVSVTGELVRPIVATLVKRLSVAPVFAFTGLSQVPASLPRVGW